MDPFNVIGGSNMTSKYMVRFSFPKLCVTFNQGTKYEFKSSLIDYFSNSIDEITKIDCKNDKRINLSQIHSYRKLIWEFEEVTDRWTRLKEETIFN